MPGDVVAHGVLYALLPSLRQNNGLMFCLGILGAHRGQRQVMGRADPCERPTLSAHLSKLSSLLFRKNVGVGYIYQRNRTAPITPPQTTFQVVSSFSLDPTLLAMALENGKYTISSKLDGAPVGRRLIENADTLPKGIFKLPENIGPSTTIWEVETLENGNYKLKANHSIVGAIDGLLFANLFDELTPSGAKTEWTLQPDERDTDANAYVVMTAGQQVGWVAPTGEDEQIAVKPILAGFTIPPTFSPTEVFVFKKWEDAK